MRIIVPLHKMYLIRHLLRLSVAALNYELELYVSHTWHQELCRKVVSSDGGYEERLFVSGENCTFFINIESFVKQFDQGHLFGASMNELLVDIRNVLSS